MTRHSASLRLRLFGLILIPLILVAILLGFWRVKAAQITSEELFDRSLFSAALAISRDVAVSDGDALQPWTRDLIRDAAGGEVFYHATGPGGIYMTGYAYPPRPETSNKGDLYAPQFFISTHRGKKVRVLRLTERLTFKNLTGDATMTVWQKLSDRQALTQQLTLRAAGLMGGLLVTLALVVWFGVARGLRPLVDLEDAISIRSPDDLSRIKRLAPIEMHGIVQTLNRLFRQVEISINAHQTFISDAAHQLRNPAAAVQSMAETIQDAPASKERDMMISELVSAARNSARVTEQLLSLEHLQHPAKLTQLENLELCQLVHSACADIGPQVLLQGIEFELISLDHDVIIHGDHLFLAEAIKNLIDNALKHAGEKLKKITVQISSDSKFVRVTVVDDGKGLSPDQRDKAFSRFSQIEPSEGSGLGLAIANTVATRHNGTLSINQAKIGASLTLSLPKKAHC